MKLYQSSSSPNSRRVRIFLAEKNIPVTIVPVDLGAKEQFSDAYRAINPRSVVPTLVLDDGTAIGEVTAIWRYLEEAHPGQPLLGTTAKDKAQVTMWERRAEQEGFAVVMEAVRNTVAGLKGRALAGPHAYEQIPELAERSKLRAACPCRFPRNTRRCRPGTTRSPRGPAPRLEFDINSLYCFHCCRCFRHGGGVRQAAEPGQRGAHRRVERRVRLGAQGLQQPPVIHAQRLAPQIAHLLQFVQRRHERRQRLHQPPLEWLDGDLAPAGGAGHARDRRGHLRAVRIPVAVHVKAGEIG